MVTNRLTVADKLSDHLENMLGRRAFREIEQEVYPQLDPIRFSGVGKAWAVSIKASLKELIIPWMKRTNRSFEEWEEIHGWYE